VNIEFEEEKVKLGPKRYEIRGQGGVGFYFRYTITDEAVKCGHEDMYRKLQQEKGQEQITQAILEWSTDYIRENSPKTEDGVPVYVTRRVRDRILLMHPREFADFLAFVPKRIAMAHQLGLYTFGEGDAVAFTEFDITEQFIKSIYQAISDFMANTMTPCKKLSVIVPMEEYVQYSRDPKMAREILEDMEGQQIFNAAGHDVYCSSKVNEIIVIEPRR